MESIWHFLKKFLNIEHQEDYSVNVFVLLIALLLSTLLLPFAISNILMILFVLYTIYYVYKNKIKPHFSYISYLFFFLYFLMLISWFWSIDKPMTFVALQRSIHYFLIPFLFAYLPKFRDKEVNTILRFFSISMVLYALFFLFSGSIHFLKTGSVEQLSHHALVSPLDLNRVMVSVFMATAYFYWLIINENSKLRYFSISILIITILLLTSKMIVISTLIISIIIFSIKMKKSKFFKFRFFILFPMILLIIYFSTYINKKFISEMIPRYSEILNKKYFGYNYYFNGAELRILYTRFLVELNQEEPIFFKGYGLSASQTKINQKTKSLNMYPGYGLTYNFHNQFNQNMAEIGIFGFLILGYILFHGIKKSYLENHYFFLTFLIVFTMFLITDTPLSQQRGIYLFIFLYFINENLNKSRLSIIDKQH